MEHGLARRRAHVDGDTVIRQPLACSDVGDELEHPLRLLRRKLADLAERVDVPLGQDEQVDRRLRLDVADGDKAVGHGHRSEEHTSELQSHVNLVCRLLLEKKKALEYVRLAVVKINITSYFY